MLDFVVGADGVIVVSLDGQWTCEDPDAMALSEKSLMVRTVQLSSSGEACVSCPSFILVVQIEFSLSKPLKRTSR